MGDAPQTTQAAGKGSRPIGPGKPAALPQDTNQAHSVPLRCRGLGVRGLVAATRHARADRGKEACRTHAYEYIKKLGLEEFGWEGAYGCGLCQTGGPCEDRNPTEPKGG